MPCNNLTIQVVGLDDATLLGLLTPDLTLAAAKAALADLGLETKDAWERATADAVSLYAREGYEGFQIDIRAGRVRVNGVDRARMDEVGAAVGAAMKTLAVALLGQRVAEQLQALSGVVPEVVESLAEQDGQYFPAQRLTVTW